MTFITTIKDFYNWISDNPYFVGEGQLVDIKNLNIWDKAPLIVPAKQPSSAYTSTKKQLSAVDGFIFCADGYIYHVNGNNVKITTDASNIKSAIRWNNGTNDRYVWIHWTDAAPKLGKIDVVDAWTTSRWTPASYTDDWTPTDWTTLRQDNNGYAPMLEFQSQLYIGCWTKIIYLDSNDSANNWLTGLTSDVVSMTPVGQMIRIYLEDWTILYWNGTDANWNEKLNLQRQIKYAFGQWNIDLVVCNNTSVDTELYLVQWYSFTPLKTFKSGFELQDTWGHNLMTQYAWVIYFAWDWISPWVYAYGSFSPNLKRAFNYEYVTDYNDVDYNEVTLVHEFAGNLYIGYYDWTDYWLDKVDLWRNSSNTQYDNGFFVTRVFDMNNRNKKKFLKEVRVHWEVWASDTVTIAINTNRFYQAQADRQDMLIDSHTGFTTIATIDNTDSAEQNDRYGTSVDVEFYSAQFKVDISDGAKVTQIDLIYDMEK